jgi:hypothetical protein
MSHLPDDTAQGAGSITGFAMPSDTVVIGRIVYATITLMSVLVIYDGWQHLRVVDVVGVILGPIIAMFIAHTFSAILARQVTKKRRLRFAEHIGVVRKESRFLLFAVPALALLVATQIAGASLNASIHVIVLTGAASLGYWGYVAGRRADLTGWRLAAAIVAGLAAGGAVLVLQVVLQPGKVATGGEI